MRKYQELLDRADTIILSKCDKSVDVDIEVLFLR